jgi:hypothetical protein
MCMDIWMKYVRPYKFLLKLLALRMCIFLLSYLFTTSYRKYKCFFDNVKKNIFGIYEIPFFIELVLL